MLYAAMRETVFAVADHDSPAAATATSLFEGPAVECLAHPGETLLVGTRDDGLHRSVDGESWERVDPAGMSERVTSLAASPHDPQVAWAGTEPSAVWRSEDGGESWTEVEGLTGLPSASEWSFPPRPHTHHARWLELDPHDPHRLYVGVEAGAFVRCEAPDGWNGPVEWTERQPGSRRDNHTLATHPDAEGRVYAAAGDGYAESTDGGESWHELQEGLDHRYVWSVAVDPDDPETRLVSAASGAYSAHRSGSAETYVYRREGEGAWRRLDGLPTGEGVLRAVLAPGQGAGEIYALHNEGLYRTTDAGERWSRLDVAWPDAYRSEAPRALVVRRDG